MSKAIRQWALFDISIFNLDPRLSGQNCKFLTIPKRDLDTKKTPPNLEVLLRFEID